MADAPPPDLTDVYDAAGQAWNVDPAILQSIQMTETGSFPNAASAVSPAGATGLMQFMPGTAAQVGITDPNDPVQSVFGAAKYYRQLLDQYKDPTLALQAYNAGPDRVNAYLAGRAPLPAETAAYVPKIQSAYQNVQPYWQDRFATSALNAKMAQLQAPNGVPAPDVATAAASDSSPGIAPANGSAAPPKGTFEQAFDAAAPGATNASAAPIGAAVKLQLGAFEQAFDAALPQPTATQTPSAPGGSSTAPLYQTVGPHPAPDGSGQMTNLSDADYQRFNANTAQPTTPAPSTPPAPAPNHPPPGMLGNLGAGIMRGLQDVPDAINRGTAYVDRNVPPLAWLDRQLGENPQAAVDAQPAAEAAYQPRYGNSSVADVGRFAGNSLAALPFTGPVDIGVGLLGAGARGALTEALPDTAMALGNLGTATGGVGRAIVAGIGGAARGAAVGATQAAVTGGNPLQGAETGAEFGGALGAAVPIVRGVAGAAGSAGNALTSVGRNIMQRVSPSAARSAIDSDIDAQVARARAASGQEPYPAVNPLVAQPLAPSTNPLMANGGTTPLRTEPVVPFPARSPSGGTPGASGAPIPPGDAAGEVPPVPPASVEDSAPTSAVPAGSAAPVAPSPATRATAFNQRFATQAPLRFDNTEYVPGSVPTLAEQLANPELASQQRVISSGNPDFATRDRANNEARLDYFDNLAGTPSTLAAMEADRAAQAEQDLSAAWQNKGTADAQPVADQINQALSGPSGKLRPVRDALEDVGDALYDQDGNLETDPEMLYGARKQISYLLSKAGQRANPAYADRTVMSQLQAVRNTLDSVIEPAAPGYQQYLQNYAAASRPIDAQELLQSYRPNLVDARGNMQLGRVNTMMKQIGQQLSSRGVAPAKSLDDDTIDKLFNLRQDLLRQENRNLARPAGSDTAHNLQVASDIGMNALHAGGHVLAAHVPGGNLLWSAASDSALRNARSAATDQLSRRLLQAEPLVPPNPLMAPTNPLSASPGSAGTPNPLVATTSDRLSAR